MTTEAHRVSCDGCGTAEVLGRGETMPKGWILANFSLPALPHGAGGIWGHLCAPCQAVPQIAHLIDRATPKPPPEL